MFAGAPEQAQAPRPTPADGPLPTLAAGPLPTPAAGPLPTPAASGRRRVAIFAWETAQKDEEAPVAFYVRESAAALQRAGDDVHVFTRDGASAGDDGVSRHLCDTPWTGDAIAASTEFCNRAARAYLEEVSRGGPFQVVHGYGWRCGPAVRAAREVGVARTIVTLHSTEYERAGRLFTSGASETVRRLEHNAAHEADRAIAVSEAVRRELLWVHGLPPEKVLVVHAGTGAPPTGPAPDAAAVKATHGVGAADPLFVFIGDLSPEMGPDLLLSAVPVALRCAPNARFLFVGEGPLRQPLQERAARMGVGAAARFLGHVTGNPLWRLLCASDAAVFPCRASKPLASVLYVWSAGKPVIVTHTGPSELVWHEVTGLKVYPFESSIVWGLERVVRDGAFARWMGRNGRTAVEEAFTWDAVARKLSRVYWG